MKIIIPVFIIFLLLSVNMVFADNINLVNGTTLTSCTGTLYDSGGPGADYSDSEDYTVTLSPTNAVNVQVTFILFDVEAQPSCNRDYIKIYDPIANFPNCPF